MDRWFRNLWRMMVWITVAVTLGFLVQLFVVQWCHVPSESMQNTLYPGDCILVDKLAYGACVPKRLSGIPVLNLLSRIPAVERWGRKIGGKRLPGYAKIRRQDVVVFRDVREEGRLLVKRVIALENDHVEIRAGKVWINGEPQQEREGVLPNDSLTNDWYVLQGGDKGWTQGNYGPVDVPAGHLFMLGDHRSNSLDSRFYGFVPQGNVIGRVGVVLFSKRNKKWDWKRFLHRIE